MQLLDWGTATPLAIFPLDCDCACNNCGCNLALLPVAVRNVQPQCQPQGRAGEEREKKLKPVLPLQFRHLMWKVLQTVCILRENKTVTLATFSFGLPLLPAPVNTLLGPCQFLLTSKLSPSHKTLLYCCAIRANALG